ncbi:hypothetical protein RhiirA4_462168 [Rhizophagus irregularis]|uniref:Uncharacterized protein n=1 Tax=Rhizophagus irregularis TaxID=588596 RepID=A0A2I1GKD3_9GLOM|nr:hypothetical protein RhiirA4_462168 [Rhizophagus irregularis]
MDKVKMDIGEDYRVPAFPVTHFGGSAFPVIHFGGSRLSGHPFRRFPTFPFRRFSPFRSPISKVPAFPVAHFDDSHKEVKHQIHLQGASIILTGVNDVSIEPSNTPCILRLRRNRNTLKKDKQ